MSYEANFLDYHLQSAIDSKACCSLNEKHWKAKQEVREKQFQQYEKRSIPQKLKNANFLGQNINIYLLK